jgi:hypothetical protein
MRYLPCVAKRWRCQCNMKCCGTKICITWPSLLLHTALVRGEVHLLCMWLVAAADKRRL